MSWTRRYLTIPVDLLDLANKMGAVFDPDAGGADTFGACRLSSDGTEPATHYMCCTLLKPEYLPAFDSAEAMHQALTDLAERRGRAAPTLTECQDLHAGLVVSESEPGDLVRIKDTGGSV